MKRCIFTIFLSIAVLILLSAYERKPTDTLFVPNDVVIGRGDSCVFDISEVSGRNVLLTFWSSDNASSRLSNMYYAALARKYDDMVHVGVNFDSSRQMFEEILRRDNLDGDSLQFHVSGNDAARLINSYGLKHGFQSYMFDPSGRIIARNPSAENVNRLLGNSGS